MSPKRNKASMKAFVKALGPVEAWKGNCYAMACKAVNANLVEGVAVYGHWLGPVHAKSMFYRPGCPVVRHGWVLLPDDSVCDPTRWVFEHVKPYIYFGPADHYDEGGNVFRSARAGARPPDFDPDEDTYELTKNVLPSKAFAFVEKYMRLYESYDECEPGVICQSQLLWLAHQSPRELGEHAPAIFAAIDKLGKGAFIPIDNRMMVERTTSPTTRTDHP